jgi:phage gp29-like protein
MPSFFRRIAEAVFPSQKPLVRTRAPRDRRRWPDWLSNGLTLDRMASILRNADQGNLDEYMGLLQEIAARDPLLNGLLSVRLSALSQRPVTVKPSKQDPDKDRAAFVAGYVQGVLDNLKIARADGEDVSYEGGIKSVVESILLSVYYGASVGWIHYQDCEDYSKPVALEFLDERRFYLDIATDRLYITTDKTGVQGTALREFSPLQYVEVRNTRLSKRLPMAGFGRSILLSWWLRFGTLKDLTNYVETWGRPGLVINSEQQDGPGYNATQYEELQQFLEDYLGDTRVLLPPGFTAELLQAANGGEKIFELVDSLTERHMQFAAVGQVGSIAGDATTFAAGKQAQRVRDDLTDGDARLVAEVLEKIGRFAVSLRFGIDTPCPTIEFGVEKSIEAIKDRALAIQAGSYPLASMLKSGVPIDIREYCDVMDIPLRKDGTLDPTYIQNLKVLAQLGIGSTVPEGQQQQSRITQEPTQPNKTKYRTFQEEDFEPNAFSYVPR